MSTGSTVWDNTHTIPHQCGSGVTRIGSRGQKSWSGTDRQIGEASNEHPYSMTGQSEFLTDWSWAGFSTSYQGGLIPFNGCGNGGQFHFLWSGSVPALTANDELRLLAKLASRIRSHDWNATIFAGELHKSLEMIARSATSLTRALTYAKRGQWHKVGSSLGVSPKKIPIWTSLSNGWLQYKYGWMPLLLDAKSAGEAVAAMTLDARKTRVRALIRRTALPMPNSSGFSVSGSLSRSVSMILNLEEKVSWASSLGLLNPLSLAWELTPFSFVADWFIPIGSYLDSRGTLQATDCTWVRSERSEISIKGFHSGSRPLSGGTWYEFGPGAESYRFRRVQLNRTVGKGMPDIPLPSFKPAITIPSWARAATSVSLLIQLHGSRSLRK